MKQFLELGNLYAKESSWKDFALVKFCLFSLGLLAGMQISPKHKKGTACLAGGIFVLSYLLLMTKFLRIAARSRKD